MKLNGPLYDHTINAIQSHTNPIYPIVIEITVNIAVTASKEIIIWIDRKMRSKERATQTIFFFIRFISKFIKKCKFVTFLCHLVISVGLSLSKHESNIWLDHRKLRRNKSNVGSLFFSYFNKIH